MKKHLQDEEAELDIEDSDAKFGNAQYRNFQRIFLIFS